MNKKKFLIDDLPLTPFPLPNKLFVTEYHDRIRYDYYLMGSIGDPEEYLDLCHALRSCTPADEFFLRLNSGGGQVRTGNQIINAIHECQGTVIGFIESDCGSMATFIFLACHTWGVSKYAEWFSHTISSGNFGKESETYEYSSFLRKQTHKRIREDYKYFLTDDEIESILKGTDIYLDSDEIMERLEVYDEARSDDCNCGNCEKEPEFNLKEMIKESVAEALAEQKESSVKPPRSRKQKTEQPE